MSRLSELQKVDATADELQRWWQDAVEQRSVAIARAEAAEAELADWQEELQASETLLDLEQWQAGWKASAERAEAALAACQEELDDLMAQRDVAEQELAAMKQPCAWQKGDDGSDKFWLTGCQIAIYGLSAANDYRFCPNCGHRIEVTR